MSIYRVFEVFKAASPRHSALRLSGCLIAVLLLAGCSSSMTRVQTWEGEAAAEGSAVLKAPGEVRVTQVNGRAMSNFLMDDLALDYDLLPGENQVVFSYKTIWAKTGVVRNGESKVHVLETEPHVVSFDAQAGETYRFEFARPTSRRDAQALVENFSGAVVNDAGKDVARFELWEGQAPAASVRTPVADDSQAVDSSDVSGDNLDQLKSLWQRASEEEKRAFLRWAFE